MNGDEIVSAAELCALADLGEVLVHQLAAARQAGNTSEINGFPPELLYAAASPDEPADVEIRTRVGGRELSVRMVVKTRNAFAFFEVDVEAVFALPAPIALDRQEIVEEFTEHIGGPVLFPYVRAAVASLAGQLSVPASPLPLLHCIVDMELLTDQRVSPSEDPNAVSPHPDDDDRHVAGQVVQQVVVTIGGLGGMTRTESVCDYMIDTLTNQLIQIGGEGELQASDVDFIAEMLSLSPEEIQHSGDERQGEPATEPDDLVSQPADADDLQPYPEGYDDDRHIYGQVRREVIITMRPDMTFTRTESVCSYLIDSETGEFTQVDGDGELQAVDIDLIAQAFRTCWEETQRGDRED